MHKQTHKGKLPFRDLRKPNRDPNSAVGYNTLYGTSGHPGILEEMSETHMRISSRVANVRDRIAARQWEIHPPAEPTMEEKYFAAFCETLLADMRTDIKNDVGHLGSFLADAFASIWYGHWVGEISLYEDASSTLGARLEVFEIANSTIMSWNWKEEELIGITQQTARGGVELPRSDLLIAHYGGNFPVGKGRLRPALFWFETVKSLAISFSEQAAAAKGRVSVVLDGGTAQSQLESARDLIVDLETPGGVTGIIIGSPTGIADVRHDFPAAIIDPTNGYNYFDGQVDQLFDSALTSLGLTSGYGSRALGDILASADAEKARATLDALGYLVGKQLFRWIAGQFSFEYNGRLPLLRAKKVNPPASPTELINTISTAVNAGLLDITPAIKEQILSSIIDTPVSE